MTQSVNLISHLRTRIRVHIMVDVNDNDFFPKLENILNAVNATQVLSLLFFQFDNN